MTNDEIQHLDNYRARLEPARRDDLKPEVEKFIGRDLLWQACWVIEHGPYEGQWAMQLLTVKYEGFLWVPFCDLEDVRPSDEEHPLLVQAKEA